MKNRTDYRKYKKKENNEPYNGPQIYSSPSFKNSQLMENFVTSLAHSTSPLVYDFGSPLIECQGFQSPDIIFISLVNISVHIPEGEGCCFSFKAYPQYCRHTFERPEPHSLFLSIKWA